MVPDGRLIPRTDKSGNQFALFFSQGLPSWLSKDIPVTAANLIYSSI
jgi:hypothetical protein